MSNVIAMIIAPPHVHAPYVTAWKAFYASCLNTMDRDTAIRLSNSHADYLKKRDAEVLAGVAKAMGEA